MLVPSMTLNEVYKELTNDFEYIKRKGSAQGKLLQKEMIRKGIKQQTIFTTCKSSRRNEWNIVYEMDHVGIKTAYYVKSTDKVSLVVYSFMFHNIGTPDEEIYLLKYYKHFFDRYNQRLALGFTETSKIVKHFFKNNFDVNLGISEMLENGICSSPFAYAQGLGISWKNEVQKTYHVKTFVASNMLTKGQQELIEHLRNADNEEFKTVVKLEHLRKAL
jgi:hypothetical protein